MDLSLSLSQAFNHTRWMLFQPFRIGVWFALGVIAFLDALGTGGFGKGFGQGVVSPFENGHQPGMPAFDGYRDFVLDHLVLFVILGLVVFVIGLSVAVFVLWVSSHGRMMFVRAVVRNDADIPANWRETRDAAFSMFLFRLGFAAFGVALGLLGVVPLLFTGHFLFNATDASLGSFMLSMLAFALLALPIVLFMLTVEALLRSFVAPLMLHFNVSCLAAWRIFWPVLTQNALTIFLFLVLRLAYLTVFGIIGFIAGLVTLFLGFLPVLHQALLAPFYVFDRIFPVYLLASLGPEYDMITPAYAAEPVPGSDVDLQDLSDTPLEPNAPSDAGGGESVED